MTPDSGVSECIISLARVLLELTRHEPRWPYPIQDHVARYLTEQITACVSIKSVASTASDRGSSNEKNRNACVVLGAFEVQILGQ
jgi:hypothetical protein